MTPAGTNVHTYLPIYRTKNHLGDWQIYAFTHSALLHGFIGRAVCLVVRIICTYIYLSMLFYYVRGTAYMTGPSDRRGRPFPKNFGRLCQIPTRPLTEIFRPSYGSAESEDARLTQGNCVIIKSPFPKIFGRLCHIPTRPLTEIFRPSYGSAESEDPRLTQGNCVIIKTASSLRIWFTKESLFGALNFLPWKTFEYVNQIFFTEKDLSIQLF